MKILDKWLIEGWREAHKLKRVWASAGAAAASFAIQQWPNLAPYIPSKWVPLLFIGVGALSLIKWGKQNGQADA